MTFMKDFNTRIEELNKIKNKYKNYQENSIERDLWTRADAQLDLLKLQRAEAIEEIKSLQEDLINAEYFHQQDYYEIIEAVIDHLKQNFNTEKKDLL